MVLGLKGNPGGPVQSETPDEIDPIRDRDVPTSKEKTSGKEAEVTMIMGGKPMRLSAAGAQTIRVVLACLREIERRGVVRCNGTRGGKVWDKRGFNYYGFVGESEIFVTRKKCWL